MLGAALSYILLCIGALLFPLWLMRYHQKRKRLYELASQMNGPPTIPFFGNFLKCLIPHNKLVGAMLDSVKYYKSPTRFWFGPHLVVHVWDPKHLEIVLNNPQCMAKDSYVYGFMEGIFGKGLVVLDVEPWKRHRRMIAPAFNPKNLEGFFDIFRGRAATLVKELRAEADKGVFDFEKYAAKSTMDVVLEAILDFGGNKSNPDNVHLMDWLDVLHTTVARRCTKPWLYPDFMFQRSAMGKRFKEVQEKFNGYIDSIIENWKKEVFGKQIDDADIVEESVKPVKFVEHLLSISDESGKFTAEELRDEVKTIIIAGMETTSSAIGYTLLALGMYPEIQQKLYEEIIELVGPTRELQYEDLKKLELLDRVTKESLRVFPGGAGIARYNEQEIQLDGYTIPARCTILVGLVGLHRDPNIWPDPSRFDPDRFLPENVAKRHAYSWMPFSAGPRNCVGLRYAFLEIKAFIVELVRNYEIATPYKRAEDVDIKWLLVFKPLNGFNVSLKSRT